VLNEGYGLWLGLDSVVGFFLVWGGWDVAGIVR